MSVRLQPKRELTVDKLRVRVYGSRQTMAVAAARAVADTIRRCIDQRGSCVVVFAAAPSQKEFLEALRLSQAIDWSHVKAFHLDEYLGLPEEAPQRFSRFLKEKLFDWVPLAEVHYLNGNADDPQKECIRYSRLLAENPIDIACIGIGENGHIAFNDPPVADFEDPYRIKVVELDEKCRLQQVHDGCFASLAEVPTHALTMTIPSIMSAKWVYCAVPGPTKQEAVKSAIEGPISTACPASILRRHPRSVLFLDSPAASLLE